jgi:curved DNA-binding protein CbpA
MSTLYELLGALSHDSAEELRAAFRKAVRGAHPDLRPNDPDAALRFREIVRARDILGDPEQREIYDHLLDLAHLEAAASSRQAIATKIHSFTSAVIAFTATSVVIIGGYLLYAYASSSWSFASANNDAIGVTTPQLTLVSLPSSLQTTEKTELSGNFDRKPIVAEPITFRTIASTQRGPHSDLIANEEAGSMQASRFNHDDDFTIAGIGPALQPAVIFYRQQKIDGAFTTLPARTIPTSKICSSAPKKTGRLRPVQSSLMPLRISVFQSRISAREPSREKRVALIR